MKIGFWADIHLSDSKPKARMDQDFFATQMTKLRFGFDRMYSEGVQLIAFSGDIFDTPRVSNRVKVEFGNLLREAKARNINVVATLGQHDVNNYNFPKWKKESDVAILAGLGLIDVLISGETKTYGDVVVHGYAIEEPETNAFLDGKAPLPTDGKFHIALVHALVSSGASEFWRDIADCNIKSVHVASFADVHRGFEPHSFGNALKTVAFSCGTMSRMKRTEAEYVPKFAILDTEKRNLQFVEIPHAEASFTFSKKEETKRKDITRGVVNQLERARSKTLESKEEMLVRIGTANDYTIEEVNFTRRFIKGL